MSVMLPKEINYTLPVSLPSGCELIDVNVLPSNGTVFACNGSIVQFDLPMRAGFADFKTLSIRYKGTLVVGGTSKIRCTPFYAPISRLEVLFGSQVAQNVNNYGQVMNMLTNCRFNVEDKIGGIAGYGWKLEGNDNVMTLQGCDGRACGLNEVFTLYGPLPCILSEADRYLPTGLMGSIRVQLTLDQISNIFAPAGPAVAFNAETGTPFSNATIVPTDFTLSDWVLSYSMVTLGSEVDNAVRSMGDKITIKSQSYSNSSNALPIGTNGQIELIYSQKMASVKALFLHCSSNSTNGIFDAFEITNGGDLQFSIASKLYPSRPLSSAVAHRGTLQLELKKALGSLYDKKNSMSINTQEYLTLGTASTVVNPAKVYYGVNTQTIQSYDVLLSGVSTQNSPITCRIIFSTPTTATVNASLISAFDCLIEIEPSTKSARVIQ